MRKRIGKRVVLSGMLFIFFVSAVIAATEIDEDFMRRIEDTTKSLDSNVAQKDAKAAMADAKELEDSFREVEAFFTKKGDAADAVVFSQKSRALASEVAKDVAAN
ncbi:MAG: hypothetical protein ACXWJE_12000, partial [Burkholderiaceae bacterium]